MRDEGKPNIFNRCVCLFLSHENYIRRDKLVSVFLFNRLPGAYENYARSRMFTFVMNANGVMKLCWFPFTDLRANQMRDRENNISEIMSLIRLLK